MGVSGQEGDVVQCIFSKAYFGFLEWWESQWGLGKAGSRKASGASVKDDACLGEGAPNGGRDIAPRGLVNGQEVGVRGEEAGMSPELAVT